MRATVPPDLRSYSYAGTGYANPHAVTSVGGVTYTYDNNGNVTAIGSLDYTWDWRNRLASAERGSGGTTYGYDHTGQRVFQATGSATTSYANRYYNVASSSLSATTTKHIFSPDGTLLATVVGTGSTTATTTYLHLDHLGGTNVTTDEDGEVTQTLDYYPYGSHRIATGSFDEQRKFTGHEYDSDSDLTYANARYYQQNIGRWLSLDPASRDNPGQFLTDPQQTNGYSYGRNNPLILVDRNGRKVELATRQLNDSGWPISNFGHAFLIVSPDNPDTIGSIDGINTSGAFTLGAYANADNMLYKSANASSDYAAVTGDCPTCARVTINPPRGVSSEEFDKRIVASYNATPNVLREYGKMGQVRWTGAANSNNAATTFLNQAGINNHLVNTYQMLLFGQNQKNIPGLGQSAYAPTHRQSAQRTVNALSGFLSSSLSGWQQTVLSVALSLLDGN